MIVFETTSITTEPLEKGIKHITTFNYTGDDSDIIEMNGCGCIERNWGNGKLFATHTIEGNSSATDIKWLNEYYPNGYEEYKKTLTVGIKSDEFTQVGMQKVSKKFITLEINFRVKLPNYPTNNHS
jgi:hypothetical protein